MIEVTVIFEWWLQDEIKDLLFSQPVQFSSEMSPYTTDCTIGKAILTDISMLSAEFLSFFPVDENSTELKFDREALEKLDERLIWLEIKKWTS